jgi:DNA helicase-2/ATP-dependent DNA helicase PcrA
LVPLRREQIDEAEKAQHLAAHDTSEHVRVVAGPGTGKSATIEERVCWLLAEEHVAPECIVAVSFTRASAMDLGKRIEQARADPGLEGDPVAVSTLHSLALRTLRRAGALEAYPADPTVLGPWELRNIFEAEFGKTMGIRGVTRPEQIRRDHEAFWDTGEFDPPNVIPPDPPISDEEREKFNRFHGPRTQLYSCVLPGEVVARCVERMEAGTLDPAELLGIEHLIVDEFQDLNPMDLRFVHGLAERGVRLFVAGDDDQSLYAFRHATPQGIEQFTHERPGSGDHTLHHCFRCAPRVLDAAQTLIRKYAADGRIEKNLVSLWADADPPVPGALGCWSFLSGRAEARAIAQSCQRLIGAGMEPSQIMILLASKTTPGRDIEAALDELEVPYAPVDEQSVTDTEPGRVGYALLSVVVEPMNYVAHRSLFGLRQGVGLGTCNDVARAVIANNRNYRDLFYSPVPDGLVVARAKTAIARTADVCADLAGWGKDEPLAKRVDDICRLVDEIRAEPGASEDLRALLEQLPAEMTIEEAHLFLSASKDDDRVRALTAMAARLEQPEPDTSLIPERVQVMTMHGVKGLSAKVVFIPGLEDALLPGEKRRAYPGLVLEAARMLFVSITRARVVCVLSHARTRFVNGANTPRTVSRFTSAVGKPFSRREDGLSTEQATQVVTQADGMQPPQDQATAA